MHCNSRSRSGVLRLLRRGGLSSRGDRMGARYCERGVHQRRKLRGGNRAAMGLLEAHREEPAGEEPESSLW